jgi:hypothetical protein
MQKDSTTWLDMNERENEEVRQTKTIPAAIGRRTLTVWSKKEWYEDDEEGTSE